MTNIFLELTIILILAGGIATVISFFKQPPIIAYLLTGLIIGPFGYYHIHDAAVLQGLGEIGITLLLFLVGLELDIRQLKRLGITVIAASLGQIILTLLLGYGLLQLLGFASTASWFIATALAFSSTVITVKLLTERQDLHSLYGKIAVGILLLQDFAVIFLLIFLSGNNTSVFGALPNWQLILLNLAKAAVLIWLIHWASTFIFPRILKIIGKSDELLLVFSLAWALGLAALVSLPVIGFNLEIGGFLAGLALAQSAMHYEIGTRVKSLRDFFVIIFFIVLGAGLVVNNASQIIAPAIIIALFVLIIKPFIIMVLLGLSGYKPRTSFMTGNSLGQISEFSLILAALALKFNFIDAPDAALLTLVAILSIAGSSYLVMHADAVYEFLRPALGWVDFRRGAAERGWNVTPLKHHTIVVGAHRLGRHIIDVLRRSGQPFIIVDHNPEIIEQFQGGDISAICGDIADSRIQELAGLAKARLLISTIPSVHENVELIEAARKARSKARLIMTAQDEEDALALYAHNVDYVLLPHFIGGLHFAKILHDDAHLKSLKKLKSAHLRSLQS